MIRRKPTKETPVSRHRTTLIAVALSWIAAPALAQSLCPDPITDNRLPGGPDYRKTTPAQRKVVEAVHFPPHVENLVRGATGSLIAGDIAYTLNMYPNHHRALLALSRLAERDKTVSPPGARYSLGCWFERAEKFAPDDGTVRLLHALHLIKERKLDDARAQLALAVEDPTLTSSGNLNYNLGLAYLKLGDYDKALEYAHKAYGMGFQLPGLKNMLVEARKWREPMPATPAPEEPASPQAGDAAAESPQAVDGAASANERAPAAGSSPAAASAPEIPSVPADGPGK